MPDVSERLNIYVNGLTIAVVTDLITEVEYPSSPRPLLFFKLLTTVRISCAVQGVRNKECLFGLGIVSRMCPVAEFGIFAARCGPMFTKKSLKWFAIISGSVINLLSAFISFMLFLLVPTVS